jgi:hypothetical protein
LKSESHTTIGEREKAVPKRQNNQVPFQQQPRKQVVMQVQLMEQQRPAGRGNFRLHEWLKLDENRRTTEEVGDQRKLW